MLLRKDRTIQHWPMLNEIQPQYVEELSNVDNSLRRYKNFILKEMQKEGITNLIRGVCKQKFMICADDMGIGKTIQSLVAAKILQKHSTGPCFLVVLVPKGVLLDWKNTITGTLRLEYHNVLLLDEESNLKKALDSFVKRNSKPNLILMGQELFNKHADMFQEFPDQSILLVVDEAHKCKPKSLSSRAIKSIELKVMSLIVLTGTPMSNNITDLTDLIRFASFGDAPSKGVLPKYLKFC